MTLSNDEIMASLEAHGVKFVSGVKDSCVRDPDGNWISYKNGDRFIYIEKMANQKKS